MSRLLRGGGEAVHQKPLKTDVRIRPLLLPIIIETRDCLITPRRVKIDRTHGVAAGEAARFQKLILDRILRDPRASVALSADESPSAVQTFARIFRNFRGKR